MTTISLKKWKKGDCQTFVFFSLSPSSFVRLFFCCLSWDELEKEDVKLGDKQVMCKILKTLCQAKAKTHNTTSM
jgi:hypothetical protein